MRVLSSVFAPLFAKILIFFAIRLQFRPRLATIKQNRQEPTHEQLPHHRRIRLETKGTLRRFPQLHGTRLLRYFRDGYNPVFTVRSSEPVLLYPFAHLYLGKMRERNRGIPLPLFGRANSSVRPNRHGFHLARRANGIVQGSARAVPSLPARIRRRCRRNRRKAERILYRPARQRRISVFPLPWLSYTHISHTVSGKRDAATPLFDWGKYRECGGKILLPYTVQVHHSFADGLHVAKFAQKLQTALDTPGD